MEGTTKVSKVFKCPSCPYESKLKANLKQHVKGVHLKIKDFVCDQCGEGYSLKDNLRRHIHSIHLNLKEFECDQCGKSFAVKSNLNQHVKAVHLKIKDFKCDHCEGKFFVIKELTQHVKSVHLRIKDIECNKCDASFSSKWELNHHLKTCTGKSPMSSMEFKMKQVLDELKIEHMYNSTHDDLRGSKGRLRFDFIVPTPDESYFMIEMNGQHHYGPTRFGGIDKDRALEKFERQLSHDGLKRAYCSKNNYPLLEVKYDDPREYKVILKEFISDNNISV